MAEHLLDGLDVRASGDGQAGRGVTELVRGQAGKAGLAGGRVEDAVPEVGVAQDVAVGGREDQGVRQGRAGDETACGASRATQACSRETGDLQMAPFSGAVLDEVRHLRSTRRMLTCPVTKDSGTAAA